MHNPLVESQFPLSLQVLFPGHNLPKVVKYTIKSQNKFKSLSKILYIITYLNSFSAMWTYFIKNKYYFKTYFHNCLHNADHGKCKAHLLNHRLHCHCKYCCQGIIYLWSNENIELYFKVLSCLSFKPETHCCSM